MLKYRRLTDDIRRPVTLRQAVWIEYKFWQQVKTVPQTKTNNNPYVEVNYSEYIELQRNL